MKRHETAQIIVSALKLLGCHDAKPQLPNRELTRSEAMAAIPRLSQLHKHITVALWQPEQIRRFRQAMEIHEAVADSRMRIQ